MDLNKEGEGNCIDDILAKGMTEFELFQTCRRSLRTVLSSLFTLSYLNVWNFSIRISKMSQVVDVMFGIVTEKKYIFVIFAIINFFSTFLDINFDIYSLFSRISIANSYCCAAYLCLMRKIKEIKFPVLKVIYLNNNISE